MPNNSSVVAELGLFYLNNGDYHHAITYFERLAKQAPNNDIAYSNISACYYLIGDIEQAIDAVKLALALQPHADSYANLGTMYFILKDYDSAVIAYEKMIVFNDRDYVNWGNLADAYYFANNPKYVSSYTKAIYFAEKALELNPNDKMAISSLAYFHAYVGKSRNALFYAKKITEQDSGDDQFFVAAALTQLGQKEAAIRYLSLAINNQYSVAEIKNSPLFNSLMNESEFQQLIDRD